MRGLAGLAKVEQKPKKKKDDRKKKAAVAGQDGAEKAAEPVAVAIPATPEINYVSDIEIKLTGNEEVDRQLKDLKKVTSINSKSKGTLKLGFYFRNWTRLAA